MNRFRILQDLSHMLPAKTLQHKTHVSTNVFKRRLWNFLNFSRKKENTLESRRINSSTFSNDVKHISATWTAIPEITAINLNSRLPTHFLHSEENTGKHLEALKPLIKYDESPLLLDGNPISRNKCYETLSNAQAGDFGFVRDDNDVATDKTYGDYTSKIVATLQESQEPIIDPTIERARTDHLSIRISARNVNSPSSVKPELGMPEINQQKTRDQFKLQDKQYSYAQGNLSNTTKQQIQQQSQITQRILQTPTVISKSSPPSFETVQQSNTITKTQDYTKPSAMFAKIETLHKKGILSERLSTKPYPHREYHTWKISGIENDVIKKCDNHRFSISDTRATQQEQSARCESFQLSRSGYSGSSGNQGSRSPSSCLSSVPRRVFSSKSFSVIQRSTPNIETTRKDLSANVSIVRLRSTHSGRVSLVKLQSFSCDASKWKKSCEEDDGRNSQRSAREIESNDCDACSQEENRCQKNDEICGRTRSRRKDTCDRDSVPSQNDKCEKQRECESDPCKRHICPEIKRRVLCSWERDSCPEARQKCDAKRRVSTRDCSRQSRDPDCSQERTTDTKCSKSRKSCKRRKDCKKTDEPRVICKDSLKRKKDCRRESKYEKQCEKRNVRRKERRNCSGNNRRRSKSRQKRNSSRVSDESCRKIDGKRRYSQQSIISVLRNRRSFSTLIADAVLGTDVQKITRRLYGDCGRDKKKDSEQVPSCEKRKRKCETKKKCVKGPAECLPRKSTVDKMQTCQSTQKDEDKKSRKPMQKVCSHEEYCANRKKEPTMKDEEPKEKLMREHPSLTMKEKKLREESMKEQIDREYKEIDECKKGFKIKEKKDDETKKTCTEYKSTGVISPYKQQKDSEKYASTLNALIFSNFTNATYKPLSIQSRINNNDIPIFVKNDRMFNVMFDRSFSTTGINYQDDFAIKQATACSKIFQNRSVNNSDELPNYIEIENDNEEENDYGGPLVDQSPRLTES